MTPGIRGKLFLLSFGLIAGALLVSDLVLTSRLEHAFILRIQADLRVRAALMEPEVLVNTARSLLPDAGWTSLAQALGRRAQVRLTLMTSEGVVLGDSELTLAQIPLVPNHSQRPEVRQALQGGYGSSIRHSATLGRRMLYVAVPLLDGVRVMGVVRLALPLVQVDAAVWQLRRVLVAASLLALVVSGLISTLAAHRLLRTLRLLATSAGRMVQGDLEARTHTPGHDEIAILGKSLDHLAESLAQALRELKKERDLLGAILEGMQEGVLVVDGANCILHGNPCLREMLMAEADLVGKPILEAIRHADLMELVVQARRANTGVSRELEMAGLKPRRLLVQVRPLQSEPHHLLLVFVDVTQLRRLENLRKEFVANASHELRTPVASLRSAAETLQGALDDPVAARSFLEMIERNAARLHQLVEDLLDLSRIESRAFHIRREDIALGPFMQRMFQSVIHLAEPKGITLACTPSVANVVIQADPKALEQIMSNLLVNAVKYSLPGCHVEVDARREGDKWRLQVMDNGPGIPQEHLPRIFERFYRVDAGRSRDLGGTGLGLAIVKHLVEAMGGAVSVESEPGKGSCFAFTLSPG